MCTKYQFIDRSVCEILNENRVSVRLKQLNIHNVHSETWTDQLLFDQI